jgi:hypothetical protein
LVSPPHPEIAASAPSITIMLMSTRGNPLPCHSETKMFSMCGGCAASAPTTGTLPNFTNPLRMSIHVSGFE